jgi:hypothetical protein
MQPAFTRKREPLGLLRAEKLNDEVLNQLFLKEAICLMVPNAVSKNAAEHIVRKITGSGRLAGYAVEPSFLKIGDAWFDLASDQDRAEHISRTIQYTEETRSLCAPFPSPTDLFKLDLDLIWGPGALNLRIGGQPIYFGLPRALPPGGEVHAHFDWIGDDSPGAAGIDKIQRQYAVNLYLQLAESGGELALWNTGLTPSELQAFRVPNHAYALDEAKLGDPTLIVRPEARSLVLFDATRSAWRRVAFQG